MAFLTYTLVDIMNNLISYQADLSVLVEAGTKTPAEALTLFTARVNSFNNRSESGYPDLTERLLTSTLTTQLTTTWNTIKP